jgi:hypothetical protein
VRPETATTAGAETGARRDAHRRDRNLALELVRTTECAALASARWIGRGDEIEGGLFARHWNWLGSWEEGLRAAGLPEPGEVAAKRRSPTGPT